MGLEVEPSRISLFAHAREIQSRKPSGLIVFDHLPVQRIRRVQPESLATGRADQRNTYRSERYTAQRRNRLTSVQAHAHMKLQFLGKALVNFQRFCLIFAKEVLALLQVAKDTQTHAAQVLVRPFYDRQVLLRRGLQGLPPLPAQVSTDLLQGRG